jgi:hypothetical protein
MRRLPVTEAQFTDAVVALAKLRGWQVAHFRPAPSAKGWRTPMQGDIGFPDLVLARDGKVVFAELKSSTGKVGPGQRQWASAIGPNCHLWRPGDMTRIAEILR